MPLIKRAIEPCNLSRTRVPQGVRNELECVTNGTLANVIRQLSGLSKHAEDMFGELYRETGSILHRASQLQERVEKLQVKVTQLDSTVEEVSLHDINLRKPFKSSVIKDQQVISLATRPLAIADAYKKCEAPPVLDKLNPYREDGKDSMKFYTDPTYFFELWCHEMQRDTENQKKEIHRKRQKRSHVQHNEHKSPKTRGQAHVREAVSRRDELQKYKHGKEFAPEHMRNTPHNHIHHHHLHHHPHNQMPPHALQQQHSYPGGRPRSSNQRMSQACGGGAAPAPMRQLSQPDPRASQPSASNIENRSPSRPSSLELSAAQYQQIQNYAKAEKAAANAASAASAASNSQQVNGLAASSGGQQAHFDGPTANSNEETHVPHYQPPPPYMHADLARSTDRNSPLAESPHHTPKRAGTPSSGPRTPSTVVSPRPTQPPPAPPPGTIQSSSPMGSRSGSTSRESLPPPPPPPPGQQSEVSQTPPYSSPVHAVMTSLREESSPVRHTPSPQAKTSTPDSMTDFPPPPPPPPQLPGGTPDTPSSIHAMPPPPATPPPPEMHDLGIHNDIDHHRTTAAPPPPPPPPPPLAEGLLQESKFMANAGLSVATALVAQIDAISLNSNGSSATMSSASTGRSEETRGAEPVVDERSDLLAAIREGIQLRKVEEQRHKQEQRLHPRGRLDVQSIMEQAFEMRRKALEENGSDDDEEEYDDEDWSDEG